MDLMLLNYRRIETNRLDSNFCFQVTYWSRRLRLDQRIFHYFSSSLNAPSSKVTFSLRLE
jgi:hypothetical protein